jgi:UDP-N-acetylglucosamine acyltransferase
MPGIHPTALVDSSARLGADVEVGPFTIIGPGVVLGDRCQVGAHAVLEGDLRVGADTKIGHGTHLGGLPQDFAFQPEIQSSVVIGASNIIREYVTIHRGTTEGSATIIGDHNFLMVGVHLAHNCTVGNHCILANNVSLAGYTTFGSHIVVGGTVVFHQFMRVGDYAMVRGGTAWSKEIPPFVIGAHINVLAGINSIGLRRGGFSPAERREISDLYKLVYRSGKNLRQALAELDGRELSVPGRCFVDFLQSTGKLGLCAARQRGQNLGT